MPESELALTAILALDHFGDADKDALELLEKQLSVPGHAYQASLALCKTEERSRWRFSKDTCARGQRLGPRRATFSS